MPSRQQHCDAEREGILRKDALNAQVPEAIQRVPLLQALDHEGVHLMIDTKSGNPASRGYPLYFLASEIFKDGDKGGFSPILFIFPHVNDSFLGWFSLEHGLSLHLWNGNE
jgi:hypothetical protein